MNNDLYLALETHLSLIVERVAGRGASEILSATLALDAILNEHRNELDARLVHFLQGRSYGKALDYVRGGRNQAKGSCSGG